MFWKYEGEGIFSPRFKLCHYPYHEFDEQGVCRECEKTRAEIEELYRFYYPSFDPGTTLHSQSEGDIHSDRRA